MRYLTLALATLTLTTCTTEPEPPGTITGEAIVCLASTPICLRAESNVTAILNGTQQAPLTNGTFTFHNVPVGPHTVSAEATVENCTVTFTPVSVSVTSAQVSNVTVRGVGSC